MILEHARIVSGVGTLLLAAAAVHGGELYVAGTIGEVYVGDSTAGGFSLWGGVCLGPVEALAMDEQHVYAGDQVGAVSRFDRETGAFLGAWFAPAPVTAMVVHDGDLLVGEYGGTIRRMDPIDGTIEATLTTYGPLTAMHLIGDVIYVPGIEGSVWRGDAVTGAFEYFGCQCSSEVQGITSDADLLYVVDSFGLLQRYELADGTQLIPDITLPMQSTAMVGDGGELLISDNLMNVHRVDPGTGTILDTMTSPIAINAMQMADAQPCPTDIDADGETGFGDLLEVLAHWGAYTPGCPDLNDDGLVGFGDVIALLSSWGPCP